MTIPAEIIPLYRDKLLDRLISQYDEETIHSAYQVIAKLLAESLDLKEVPGGVMAIALQLLTDQVLSLTTRD